MSSDTDGRAISFMCDRRNRGKMQNSKIFSWRFKLSQFSYDIKSKPGVENVVFDPFFEFAILFQVPLYKICT